jgi:DNA-binding winged helix-turn-helix (wHTH) protein/TolB-like protein/Flp pilus assembly protein TadD
MDYPHAHSRTIFRFDDVLIDTENFRVERDGQEASVTPRAFDVLLLLVRNHGRVVEKQEIFDEVWKDTFVGDNALTKIIKEIRHALGDRADQPRYIETIPKRGYRFIGEISVAEVKEGSESAGPNSVLTRRSQNRVYVWSIAALLAVVAIAGIWIFANRDGAERSPDRFHSIAVLPFKPLDVNSRDESLEMGMAESLITRLNSLKRVKVLPIGMVGKYAGIERDPVNIGRETGTDAVLDGSIQKNDGRVRVTVRLIDVVTGDQLWFEHFDDNFTDIFDVQDSIAERVATALALQLSGSEKARLGKRYTTSAEAYQQYLNAQLVWHGRRGNWIDQSMSFYQQAIREDPRFALAYIGLADCYIMLNGHHRINADETLAKALPAITTALEIDPDLAEAHNALAELKYQFQYDWSTAESEFKKAVSLDPNVAWIRQAYGWYLMSLGRFDEAEGEMQKALELDPSSLTVKVGRGRLLYYSRHYDEAAVHFQNLIAVEPNDQSLHLALFAVYVEKQSYAAAFDEFLILGERRAVPADHVSRLKEAFETGGWEAFERQRLEILLEADDEVSPAIVAGIYADLGDKEKALDYLEKSIDAHEPSVIQLKIEPQFDVLRDQPRFADLLAKVGLAP